MAGPGQHISPHWDALRRLSHYEALMVASDASQEDIKVAYRSAMLTLHPDKARDRVKEMDEKEKQRLEKFVRVQQAWEVTPHAGTLIHSGFQKSFVIHC